MSKCVPADFCDNPDVVSYTPDKTHKDYYENLFNKFDLHCAPSYKTELLGSSFFLGWILTLEVIPRFSDKYGRKKFLMVGNTFQVLAYSVLISTENYSILIASILVLGMMSTIRVQVGTIYIYELMMKESWAPAYLILCLLGKGLAGLLAAIYYTYISNDFYWLLFGCVICNLLGAIGSTLFPESPRYLIATGQLSEAQKVFETIATVNGVDPSIVSLDRIESMFGSQKDTGDLSVKVKVLGQDTEAKAKETLMKAVTNIEEV